MKKKKWTEGTLKRNISLALISRSQSLTEETQGQDLSRSWSRKQEGILFMDSHLSLRSAISYTAIVISATYNGLDSPTLILNQDKRSQTWPQANLIKEVLQLRFPFPGWF